MQVAIPSVSSSEQQPCHMQQPCYVQRTILQSFLSNAKVLIFLPTTQITSVLKIPEFAGLWKKQLGFETALQFAVVTFTGHRSIV